MAYLGTLGGSSFATTGINDSGQVVGDSKTADGSAHAFITGPNGMGMADVNSYADLPDWIVLTKADGINNLGQVIATAVIIPSPPPTP